MTFRSGAVRVRVPATSANLGPGFDTAGLCLSLYDDVEVRLTAGGLDVQVEGQGAEDLPRDDRHLVVATLRAAFDRLGGQPPGLEVACTNALPQSRGMGSSSAAICAALLAARALVVDGEHLLGDDALLQLAHELEGHPDNVAACLRGGVTFAWTSAAGQVGVARVEPHPDLAPVVLVAATRASTHAVRGLLPATVPHSDAAANAARAALLPLAVGQAPRLLMVATEDRLHQGYRAPAMPGTADLVARLRESGVPAAVSGAGPSVLALTTRATRAEVAALDLPGWTALALDVDLVGARLLP